MSIEYFGANSITFLDTADYSMISKNTWIDFRLVPQDKYTIGISSPEINLSQIPGSSFVIDMSESLANKLIYSRRTGSWNFILDTDKLEDEGISPIEMSIAIKEYFNGRFVYCEFDSAVVPRSYYGRVWIKTFQNTETYPVIEIEYDLDHDYMNCSVVNDIVVLKKYNNDYSPSSDGSLLSNGEQCPIPNSIGISSINELNQKYRPGIIFHSYDSGIFSNRFGNSFFDLLMLVGFSDYDDQGQQIWNQEYEYIEDPTCGKINVIDSDSEGFMPYGSGTGSAIRINFRSILLSVNTVSTSDYGENWGTTTNRRLACTIVAIPRSGDALYG